jgi:ribosomal protein L7Ae-like RNA K-turn-binding protein
MNGRALLHVLRLIEVTSLIPGISQNRLHDTLAAIPDPRLAVLPPGCGPWLLVSTTDLDPGELLALLPSGEQQVAATELRTRVDLADPAVESLRSLITYARTSRRLALGRAAVERAAQRRRLEIVVIASDIDPGYARSIESILASVSPEVQIISAPQTTHELGTLTGTKRAGVVGLIRGSPTIRLTGQARQYHGRDVSSEPGFTSSALTRLNGQD